MTTFSRRSTLGTPGAAKRFGQESQHGQTPIVACTRVGFRHLFEPVGPDPGRTSDHNSQCPTPARTTQEHACNPEADLRSG